MFQSLLETKLVIPGKPKRFVDRPHLYEKLDQVFDHKLCLISTPPGYGKTSLIVSWAYERGITPAWLSLDERDNSFQLFFSYLVSSVQKVDCNRCVGFLEKLEPPQAVQHELFLNQFVNEMGTKDNDCILVLDDFHTIESKEIQDDIEYLLDNLPPNIHLIISTRIDPVFSIANLRAQGELLEIRYPDLSFTMEESETYLNDKFGLNLKQEEVQELVDYTEGWIVGLHLAAITLSNTDQPATFITKLHQAERYITEYLIDEVLKTQSEEVQDFLIKSSVLQCFTASLCNTAFDLSNSDELIREIERSNLFIIPLATSREWYRYHHLFSELLSSRLRKKDPKVLAEIWNKASRWSEQQGLSDDAVEYALLAKEYKRAAQIIQVIGEKIIWTGGVSTLLHWLEALPSDIFSEYPNLWIMQLWCRFNLAQFAIVADKLESRVFEKILDHIDGNYKPYFISTLSTVQALDAINRKYDIPESLRYAKAGMQHIDTGSESEFQTLVTYGKALMLAGDLEKSKEMFARCTPQIENGKGPFIKMVYTHHLSELAYLSGELHQADDLLKRAYQFGLDHHLDNSSAFYRICIDIGRINYERANFLAAQQYLTPSVRGAARTLIAYDILNGYLALFELFIKRHNWVSAKRTIQSVEYLESNCGFSEPIHLLADCMHARIAIRMRDLSTVQYWVNKHHIHRDTQFGYHEHYFAYTAIQSLVVLKELDAARAITENILRAAQHNRWGFDVIKCTAWLAAIYNLQSDLDQALKTLSTVLIMGIRCEFIQSILDCGDPITSLLPIIKDSWSREKGKVDLVAYVNRLIDASNDAFISQHSDFPGAPMTETLTDRELNVLELLSRGFSNQKIAKTLVISQNTVKFHLKNIYLKLGVRTRTQAVAIANELSLI